jgi:hypothetical protein
VAGGQLFMLVGHDQGRLMFRDGSDGLYWVSTKQ